MYCFKKMLRTLLMVGMACLWALPAHAASPTVLVNGTALIGTPSPTLTAGRVYVPFRLMANAFEADIAWDPVAKRITAVNNGRTIIFVPGEKSATVDGVKVAVDAPAKIVQGSTMLPLRFVSETFGAQVSWDKTSFAASITLAPVAAPGPVAQPAPAEDQPATTETPPVTTDVPPTEQTVAPPVAPVVQTPTSSTKTSTYTVEIGSGGFTSFKTINIASAAGVPGAALYRISDGNTTSAPKPLGTESAYMTSQSNVTITILAGNGTTVLATGTLPVSSAVSVPTTISLTLQ